MARVEDALKEDLLRAAEEAVGQDRAQGDSREGPQTRWGIVGWGLVLLAVLAGWLFGTRPEWVFIPPVAAEAPEMTAASMRLALVRERQRVERYREQNGRLPVTLAEAGSTIPTIEIAASPDGSYLLRAVEGGTALELHSSEDVERFLGNSLQVILNSPRQP
ncbi:MAG TPA: hypothetical protein VMK53_07940 [Gemmatimonadales bacterium]|nr:hypothetical protein [Gemmatimonadales bacterium]